MTVLSSACSKNLDFGLESYVNIMKVVTNKLFWALVLLGIDASLAAGEERPRLRMLKKHPKKEQSHGPDQVAEQGQVTEPFRVALWGDAPYVGNTTGVFDTTGDNPGKEYKELRDCINGADGNLCSTTEPASFAWFAGDMNAGTAPCVSSNYDRFEGLANSFLAPSLLVLGDNEWLDCHKTKTGDPHDPLVQLNYVKKRFFDQSGRNVLGVGEIETTVATRDYPENYMWEQNGIVFVGLTVVGSNNGLYDGEPDGKSCKSSLEVFDPSCVRATAEFNEREPIVNGFLSRAFDKASKTHAAGIMVMIQANMWDILECSDTVTIGTGHASFYKTLMTETLAFGGQVALINGDSHVFRLCNNAADNALNLTEYGYVENFVSVQVPGSINIGYVDAVIDPTSESVFNFTNHYFTDPPYLDP